MNYDTFRVKINDLLQAELDKYVAGEIQWNVSNQFNETILESALKNLNNGDNIALTECYVVFNAELPLDIMSLAHTASTFEVEPLAAGWTQ